MKQVTLRSAGHQDLIAFGLKTRTGQPLGVELDPVGDLQDALESTYRICVVTKVGLVIAT